MRFAVTLIVWVSVAPLASVAAVTPVRSGVAETSAAYPFTDKPINATPTSIEVRLLLCVFITNTSLIHICFHINHIIVLLHIYLGHTKPIPPTTTMFLAGLS